LDNDLSFFLITFSLAKTYMPSIRFRCLDAGTESLHGDVVACEYVTDRESMDALLHYYLAAMASRG
jgi:hypothetical protein